MLHTLPFHTSASASPPALVEVSPTAVQVFTNEHDTPESPLSNAPEPGVAWRVQVLPSYASARVTCVPELLE
jgi:hypothetical protein